MTQTTSFSNPPTSAPPASDPANLYKYFFEASRDLICMASLEGYFLKVNPAFEKVLGYSKEEILQKNFMELIHPDDIEATKTEISSLEQGTSSPSFTNRYRCQDGSYRWLVWHSQPIEGTNTVYASAHDITEQKEVEQEITRSEEMFRLLAENMADVIMMHQPDGTIEYVSPSVKKILGYEPEELLGQNPYEFYFHPLDAERIRQESHEQLLVGEKATNAEYRIKKKNGRYTWFETTSEVILDEHQQISAIVTSSRDISSRKKEEKQADQLREHLQASNQELENFAYVASHDLQEPLRVIASYLQVLQRRYQPQLDERADQYIHYAVDGANRMKRLITDLLEYSRVNSVFGQNTEVNLNNVLPQVEESLRLMITQSQAVIQYPTLPIIFADESLIFRVFLNLISNAIKFQSQPPPVVKIAVIRQHRHWVFSVSDNGMGIAQEYHEKVFDIFQRLNGHKYVGTGMGLSIVKRTIEKYRGKIWLTSEKGKGTTFYFTIPIHQ